MSSSWVLHLVRHGESAWNLAGRVQGQHPAAGGLTPRGIAQAHQSAELLAAGGGAQAKCVFASDLLRARETAAIVADRLGLPVVVLPALREQHFGILEGHQLAERWETGTVESAVAGLWANPSLRPAGGESVLDLHVRISAALREISSSEDVDGLIITHGGPIRVMSADGAALRSGGPRRSVPNGSILTLASDGTSSLLAHSEDQPVDPG